VADHVFFEDDQVVDFQITFGSLPNHHCILDSLDNKQPDIPYNDALFASLSSSSSSSNGCGSGRFTDPGAGAFSYSMGRSFVAKRDLAAGSEMYVCLRSVQYVHVFVFFHAHCVGWVLGY
jgi:hypothetical protein